MSRALRWSVCDVLSAVGVCMYVHMRAWRFTLFQRCSYACVYVCVCVLACGPMHVHE
jgi:hypothetical protein